jgi:deoxycytidine triphosphate deaminase
MASPPGKLEPGVLPHQEIIELCGLKGNNLDESHGKGPIQPCSRRNVRSASYDLRLGREYHSADGTSRLKLGVCSMKIAELKPGSDEHIVLPPNQVVVVSCLEKVCLPDDMIGHLTLKQDILLQGLIMASQSQIDAGYRGWIYPLLYNLSDREVPLRLNSSMIRLELVRLSRPTDQPYEGDYQERTLSESLKRPISSSLTSLNERVKKTRDQIRNTQIFAAVGAILLVTLPLLFGLVGDLYNARDRVSRLEGENVEPLQLNDEVQRLKNQVAALQCQILEQEGRPKLNRCPG